MIKPILELEKKNGPHTAALSFFLALYNVGFFIFAILYLPFFFMKGKHKAGFKTRLGFVPQDVREKLKNEKVLWIHAVSVGEMVQAVRLSGLLKDHFKTCKILLTTTTVTGAEVCAKLKAEEDTLLYFPIDLGPCVKAFIQSINPVSVIVLETEIWPNLIFELHRRNIPVFIVNGRISDKAFPKYLRVKSFVAPVLQRLSAIGAQDELMRFRFMALGAGPEACRVTGNMKFDWQPHKAEEVFMNRVKNLLCKDGSFLLIAGSTHEGEEAMLLDIYKNLKKSFPKLKLLIAPRHLNRLEAIESVAKNKKVTTSRLSFFGETKGEEGVYILDKMGVLAWVYSLADAVFVGGSLVPVGGHNLVEPAFFEKAILHGPYMGNFREMSAEFAKHHAALSVQNAEDLEKAVSLLIKDEKSRQKLGLAAKNLILKHQGASERNRELLAPMLDELL